MLISSKTPFLGKSICFGEIAIAFVNDANKNPDKRDFLKFVAEQRSGIENVTKVEFSRIKKKNYFLKLLLRHPISHKTHIKILEKCIVSKFVIGILVNHYSPNNKGLHKNNIFSKIETKYAKGHKNIFFL